MMRAARQRPIASVEKILAARPHVLVRWGMTMLFVLLSVALALLFRTELPQKTQRAAEIVDVKWGTDETGRRTVEVHFRPLDGSILRSGRSVSIASVASIAPGEPDELGELVTEADWQIRGTIASVLTSDDGHATGLCVTIESDDPNPSIEPSYRGQAVLQVTVGSKRLFEHLVPPLFTDADASTKRHQPLSHDFVVLSNRHRLTAITTAKPFFPEFGASLAPIGSRLNVLMA